MVTAYFIDDDGNAIKIQASSEKGVQLAQTVICTLGGPGFRRVSYPRFMLTRVWSAIWCYLRGGHIEHTRFDHKKGEEIL